MNIIGDFSFFFLQFLHFQSLGPAGRGNLRPPLHGRAPAPFEFAAPGGVGGHVEGDQRGVVSSFSSRPVSRS